MPSRSVKVALLAGAVVVAAVAMVAVGTRFTDHKGGSSQAIDLHGTVALTGAAFGPNDGTGHCGGVAGYNDIATGGSVVVQDASGKTIATGTLGLSTPGDFFDDGNGQSIPASCGFPFEIPAVPDATFYGVVIGHRNAVTYSKAQVEAGPVKLSLGS